MRLERTPSQTVGPFFSLGLCEQPHNALVAPDAPRVLTICGRVLDGAGSGVPDAMVEVWQADDEGVYRGDFGWGRCGTDAEGAFEFSTVKPGPVADADGSHQAPHLTVLVFARGLLKPVLTRMYFPDEVQANANDPVLAAIADPVGRATLIADPDTGAARLRFDIRLQGDRQTLFFAL